MPSERHQSAESYSDSEQLEVSPSYESSIQFAPNVTPSTYPTEGLPSPSLAMQPPAARATTSPSKSSSRPSSPVPGSEDDPMAHYAWYESLEGGARKKKNRRAREDPNYVPRPPNSFMLFRWWYINHRRNAPIMDMSGVNLSRMIGTIWTELPAHEQAKWNARAASVAKEHAIRHPDKFEPQHDPEKKLARRANKAVNKGTGPTRGHAAADALPKSKKSARKGKEARFIITNPSAISMADSDATPVSSSVPSSVAPSPTLAPTYLTDSVLAAVQVPHPLDASSPIDLQALSVPHVPDFKGGNSGLIAPQARHPIPNHYVTPGATAHFNGGPHPWGPLRRSSSVGGLAEYAAQQHQFHPQFSAANGEGFAVHNGASTDPAALPSPFAHTPWYANPHANMDFSSNANAYVDFNLGHGLNGSGSGFADVGNRRMSMVFGREVDGRRPSTAAPSFGPYYPHLGHGELAYPPHAASHMGEGLNAHAAAHPDGLYLPQFASAPIEHRTDVAPGIFSADYSIDVATHNPTFLSSPAPGTTFAPSEYSRESGSPAERNSFDFNAMTEALQSTAPALTVDPNYTSTASSSLSPSEINSAASSAPSDASYSTLTPAWDPYTSAGPDSSQGSSSASPASFQQSFLPPSSSDGQYSQQDYDYAAREYVQAQPEFFSVNGDYTGYAQPPHGLEMSLTDELNAPIYPAACMPERIPGYESYNGMGSAYGTPAMTPVPEPEYNTSY